MIQHAQSAHPAESGSCASLFSKCLRTHDLFSPRHWDAIFESETLPLEALLGKSLVSSGKASKVLANTVCQSAQL